MYKVIRYISDNQSCLLIFLSFYLLYSHPFSSSLIAFQQAQKEEVVEYEDFQAEEQDPNTNNNNNNNNNQDLTSSAMNNNSNNNSIVMEDETPSIEDELLPVQRYIKQ